MSNIGKADQTQNARNENYINATVKDKDSDKKIVINFPKGAVLRGNKVQYEFKPDGVYLNGKKLDENILELTKYQVAAVETLAQTDITRPLDFNEKFETMTINKHDLSGAQYAEDLDKKLASEEYLSSYQVAMNRTMYPAIKSADATEHGHVYAEFIDPDSGDKGRFEFFLPNENNPKPANTSTSENKPWWQFWK